ncbi:MAG: hypothetical protein IMZ50_05520 [Candidatus Atribacteria bacterium]|nr:hypothetical protein [Candidatus Atribacteria bacterium]
MKTYKGILFGLVIGLTIGMVIGDQANRFLNMGEHRPSAPVPSVATIDGVEVSAPPGATIRVVKRNAIDNTRKDVNRDRGNLVNPDQTQYGKTIDGKLTVKPGALNMPGASGRTGGMAGESTVTGGGVGVMLIAGAGLIVVGILVWLWLGMPSLGLALIAAGGALILINFIYEEAPWLIYVALGLGLVVAVIAFIKLRKGKVETAEATTALTEVITGVDDVKDQTPELAKGTPARTKVNNILAAAQVKGGELVDKIRAKLKGKTP